MNNHYFLGIDPGLTGGCSLLDVSYGSGVRSYKILDGFRLPVIQDSYGVMPMGKNGKKILDYSELGDNFRRILRCFELSPSGDNFSIVIEKQQELFNPRGGRVAGSFMGGFNYGLLLMVLNREYANLMSMHPPVLGKYFHMASPSWKVEIGIHKSKDTSYHQACDMFGNKYWPRVSDHGVAESALLSYWRSLFVLGGKK